MTSNAPASMSYAELLPGDALASHVVAYWHFEVRHDAGEILHAVPLTGGCILSVAVARGDVFSLDRV